MHLLAELIRRPLDFSTELVIVINGHLLRRQRPRSLVLAASPHGYPFSRAEGAASYSCLSPRGGRAPAAPPLQHDGVIDDDDGDDGGGDLTSPTSPMRPALVKTVGRVDALSKD